MYSSGAKGVSNGRLEQEICCQTKIISEEHLEWEISSGLVNGTPVCKPEKRQFFVPILLFTGCQRRERLFRMVRLNLSTMPSG
ncbi:hypothetical protein TNCV_1753111 [Trichonephila clavipes]|nr:hypothetical protein TNCV_1753111 [Trichonephila clavipes]